MTLRTAALALTICLSVGISTVLAHAFGAEGKLRIGTVSGNPPFSHVDDTGEPSGFDIEIVRALCVEMSVDCEFQWHEWEELIPELRAGTFDAIAANMSITEERRRLVSFTDRYHGNVVRFVARKGSGFDPGNAADTTIGVARATVSSDWLEVNMAGVATIELYTEQRELLDDLVAGRLDAVLGDGLGFLAWFQSSDGAGFAFAGEGLRLDEGIGIAVRKEDETLRQDLNRALRAILADGTYEAINTRYFPSSIH